MLEPSENRGSVPATSRRARVVHAALFVAIGACVAAAFACSSERATCGAGASCFGGFAPDAGDAGDVDASEGDAGQPTCFSEVLCYAVDDAGVCGDASYSAPCQPCPPGTVMNGCTLPDGAPLGPAK